MIEFANAKINIGLRILGKRPDGYHDLETIYYPIPLCDVVEVVESPTLAIKPSGLVIPGSGAADNLCFRAYELLRTHYDLPPVAIYLHKTIPIGAGLGGGSSDAVATLRALDQLFDLGLDAYQLENYARQLGSDCAFFVNNKPAWGRGKGDDLTDINLDLSGLWITIIQPPIHISTAEAYAGVTPRTHVPASTLEQLIRRPLAEWQDHLVNDFEESLFDRYPTLRHIKQRLIQQGALYASMSGSGSSIYGIFATEPALDTDGLSTFSLPLHPCIV